MDEVQILIERLERITSHKETRFDWEDWSIKCDDKRAEALRQLFYQVSEAFPGDGGLFSPQGMDVLKSILAALKKER